MNKLFGASVMLNIYLAAFIIFMLILWRETPKGNEMSELSILTALVRGGMSPVGACAMGGNMMAESAMKSNIAQRGMTGLTDERYTQAADAGTIDFIGDSIGYGLCQWTLKARKRHLLEYANNLKKSVGDESLQVSFCLAELMTDFPTLNEYLKTTTDLYEATSRICKEYERPSINNIEIRYKYTYQMYKDYVAILEKIVGRENGIPSDAEPPSYIIGTVKTGEHTPEACFLMAQLKRLGYDVLWLGLDACLRDFQQKRGLEIDGVCGEKTWRELLK